MEDFSFSVGDTFSIKPGGKRITYEILETDTTTGHTMLVVSRINDQGEYSVLRMGIQVWRDLFDCWKAGA